MNTSNEKTFEAGDIAYTADGYRVCVKAVADDTYYVSRFYTEYDYDEFGEAEQWEQEDTAVVAVNRLYTKAPTARMDRAILDLRKKIASLDEELRQKSSDAIDLDAEIGTRQRELEKLKSGIDGLDPLFDLVDGRITHFALLPDDGHSIPSIRTLKDHMSRGHAEVMSVYIGEDGSLSTRPPGCALADVDASNIEFTMCRVVPCKSEREAEEIIKRWIVVRINETSNFYRLNELMSSAKKWGAPIPDGTEQKIKKGQIERLESVIASHEEKLADIRKDLHKLRNEP